MTPGHELAWSKGKLDCKCNDCGFSSAATSRCNKCHGSSLTYATHQEQGVAVFGGIVRTWCQSTGINRGKTPQVGRNMETGTAGPIGDLSMPMRGGTGDAAVA